MGRKTTSLKINREVWDRFKIHSIQKKTDMSELIEKMIEKELKNNGR